MKSGTSAHEFTDYEFDKITGIICAYIDYLKREHNLAVSVHFDRKYGYIFSRAKILLKYNIHTNPYCFKIKGDLKQHNKCMKCQAAALRKCAAKGCYIGICHAGVTEFICGIYSGRAVAGFVSVSGYKSDKAPYCTDRVYIENMKDEEVPSELLRTVIPPLCMMIERLVGFKEIKDIGSDVYYDILNYLRERHADVSVDELVKEFNFSRSYISHMFKKKSGHTLKEYCNILKINDAKVLLEDSDMPVTEVAQASGFNNFSYFINVFKNRTGLTPLKWRMRRRGMK